MEFYTFLTVMFGVFGVFYLYIKNVYSYWERRGTPYIKPRYFYGNSGEIGKTKSFSQVFGEFYREFKDKEKFLGVFMALKPILLIIDLDLIKAVFIKDFHVFPNRGTYFNEKDDFLSANLVNLEGDRWKNLRNKLTPTFTSRNIKMMFQPISDIADNLVKHLDIKRQNNEEISMKDCLGKFTTDVIGCCAFGLDCNSLQDPNSKFFEMGQKTSESKNLFFRFLRGSFPNLARKLHVTSTDPIVADFYTTIVRNTINYREENEIIRNDFMNLLIQMKNSKGDDQLTFEEVAAQSFVFFTAGYETTANLLNYCIYELSLNEEIQSKARENIHEAMEKYGDKISYESVMEMTYLEKIINESLRKYPTAPVLGRVVNQDYKIPGTNFILEKGRTIYLPVLGIHHDPEFYPNPEIFDPERFSPDEVAKRHPMSFIPFGEGPRMCIGMRFALVEARLALAKLLLNFKFELDRSKTPVPIEFDIRKVVYQPSHGIYVKLQKVD